MKTLNGAILLDALEDRDALIATTRLWSGQHLLCLEGQRVDRRAWFASEPPEAFVEVMPEGLDRSKAMKCVTAIDVKDTRPCAATWAWRRVCWPGQLLAHDDPLVVAHRDHFAEAS